MRKGCILFSKFNFIANLKYDEGGPGECVLKPLLYLLQVDNMRQGFLYKK